MNKFKEKSKNLNIDFIQGESFTDRIMISNDKFISIAIRKKDGSIEEITKKKQSLINKYPVLNIFIIRALIRFIEGYKNILFIQITKKDLKKKMYFFFITAFIFAVFFYFILPTIISFNIRNYFTNYYILGFVEGGLRILFFLIIFYILTFVEKTNNTAKYHGAEHKTLLCKKNNDELTIENIKKYPIRDPSCGTSLIILTIIYSIPLFLILGYENLLFRIALILILIPLLIGISFETTEWIYKSNSKLTKIFSAPGLLLQKLNTKEPDEEQIEIAIIALKNLLSYKKCDKNEK